MSNSLQSVFLLPKVCVSNCKWVDSAPYRTITVRDCMSDLPEILQGGLKSGSGRAIAFHGDEVGDMRGGAG